MRSTAHTFFSPCSLLPCSPFFHTVCLPSCIWHQPFCRSSLIPYVSSVHLDPIHTSGMPVPFHFPAYCLYPQSRMLAGCHSYCMTSNHSKHCKCNEERSVHLPPPAAPSNGLKRLSSDFTQISRVSAFPSFALPSHSAPATPFPSEVLPAISFPPQTDTYRHSSALYSLISS
jgi:hypothetical protein